jgi:hypothetical protein
MKLAVAGPREAGRRVSFLLDRTGETVVTTCDRLEFFCVLPFLFPQRLLLGFQFCFHYVGISFIASERLSYLSWVPNAFDFIWRWRRCKRETEDPPRGSSVSVFLFPFQGRGTEPDRQVDPLERKCLSFPSLSVYCKIKKRSKKLEEEGPACLQSVGRGVWPNVATCLACGSRGEFIYLV